MQQVEAKRRQFALDKTKQLLNEQAIQNQKKFEKQHKEALTKLYHSV